MPSQGHGARRKRDKLASGRLIFITAMTPSALGAAHHRKISIAAIARLPGPRLGRTVINAAIDRTIARASGRCLRSFSALAERLSSSGLPVRRGRSPLVLKATCMGGEDSDQPVSSSVGVVHSQLASVLSPGHEILRLIEAPRVSFAAHRRGALSLAG